MRALWDSHSNLPYRAIVPWPRIEYNGQWDWIATVDTVESWLESQVGPHYVYWSWTMWNLRDLAGYDHCSVSFLRAQDSTLFRLRWG